MYRSILLIAVFTTLTKISGAQYYFQDIITSTKTSQNFSLLKTARIKTVTVTSIEPDGSETEGFGILQQVNSNKNWLVTSTKSSLTGSSVATTLFNPQGLPYKLVDSTINTVNMADYEYNSQGKLSKIATKSYDPSDTNRYTIGEEHIFQYDAQGQTTGMLRIKDKKDTLKVVFKAFEKGLPGIEEWWSKNRKTETWYYYYNDAGQLTDIVRFDRKSQKMLPDYVFEYNTNGQLTQQTVVQPGTNFYRVWLYDYDEKGLKKSETIFNKGKEQEGRIIYEYNY